MSNQVEIVYSQSTPTTVELVVPGPQGPTGPAGAAGPAGVGSAWRQGAGAPGSGVGVDGDYYLNTSNGDIYGPKAAGSWGAVVFNIAEGQTGPQGPAGPVGVVNATAPLSYDAGSQTVAITAATTAAAGSMSAGDKAKLDSITVDRASLTVLSVRNNSGTSIPKGAAVYVTGSSGTTVTVALADASAEATAANTLGVTFEAIAHNANGLVVTEGELTGLNTSALTEGALLWLSETTGGLTTTRPTQPAHGVVMGWCIKQGAGTSGIVYIRVDNGQELDELHDVLITSPATGQVLRRASDGLWKNQALTAGDIGGLGTDSVPEGSVNLYFSATRARQAISVSGSLSYDSANGVISYSAPSLATVATSGAYGDLTGRPTLGTAAALDHGTSAGNVVRLDGSARLPAVDGSQLTGLPPGGVTSVALSAPTGFSVSGSPITTSGTLALSFAAGYSLPTTSSQTNWDTAYTERLRWDGGATGLNATTARTSLGLGTAATTDASAYATAAQGALADTAVQPATLSGYVQTSDARLSDSREWSAATIDQAEAEAGTATTRRAFTAQRVFQAIAAWWNASAAKTKLDGIATGATANSSDATLLARTNHTGTQTASTISDFTSAAAAAAPVQSVAGRTGAVTLSSGDISGLGTAATAASTDFLPTTFTAGTITYGATVDLDMAALAGGYRTISLTGDLAFTTSNRASGRTVVIRLVCDGTQRTLAFPAGWVFVGTKPTSIAVGKTAVLSLTFFGTADTDCVAAYGVQA